MFRNFGTTLETGNLKVKDEKNVEVIELIPEWLPKSDNCSDFSMTHFFQWRSFLVTSLTHIWVCSFPVWWPRPRRLAVSAVKSNFIKFWYFLIFKMANSIVNFLLTGSINQFRNYESWTITNFSPIKLFFNENDNDI